MRQARIPGYRLHKASGQAVVTIGGRDNYLGPFDSDQSKREYTRLIERWRLRRRANARMPNLTVSELVSRYGQHAEEYHRRPDGSPTSEVYLIELACRPVEKFYGKTLVADFGPLALKEIRDGWVKAGLVRKTINSFAGRIKRMFEWAVSEELCPADVLVALRTVKGLKKGRSKAVESEPVRPVLVDHVNAVLPHVSPQVRDMIQLQLLTGCRPGEITALRPCDVNRDDVEVWEFVPPAHKMDYKDIERRIFFGPRAQAILGPYLDNRPAASFCFSPAEAEQARREKAHAARKTPLSFGNRPGTNKSSRPRRPAGERYDVESYRRAIHRACDAVNRPTVEENAKREQAGLALLPLMPRWSPNQLRHTRATDLRKAYGIESAQVVLGHSELEVTQVYAERDFDKARKIMLEVG